MGKFRVKYILSVAVLLLFVQFVVGTALLGHAAKASTSTNFALQDTTQRRQRVRNQAAQPSESSKPDSTLTINPDSILATMTDSLAARQRTSGQGTGLGQVISGKAVDSLHYDLRNNTVHLYEKGEVKYGNMQLKADFISSGPGASE